MVSFANASLRKRWKRSIPDSLMVHFNESIDAGPARKVTSEAWYRRCASGRVLLGTDVQSGHTGAVARSELREERKESSAAQVQLPSTGESQIQRPIRCGQNRAAVRGSLHALAVAADDSDFGSLAKTHDESGGKRIEGDRRVCRSFAFDLYSLFGELAACFCSA